MDRDGDQDVIAVAFDDDDLTWFENTNGDGSSWSAHTVDGNLDGARTVTVGDLDNDGDLDIIAGATLETSHSHFWYENLQTFDPDTDGDGILDSIDTDDDDDGLSDEEEINTYDTDPLLTDTDNDGLDDGDEIALGADPNNNDTDGDGIIDGDEVAQGSNPVVNESAVLLMIISSDE